MSKYDALALSLLEAKQEALKAKTGDDGGTANLDATFLILKGWREEKVLEAMDKAGIFCRGKTNWIGPGYLIDTCGGQGNDNTRVRDKFAEILRNKGYKVIHFDKMD